MPQDNVVEPMMDSIELQQHLVHDHYALSGLKWPKRGFEIACHRMDTNRGCGICGAVALQD
jgi:hypothetical protein